ncbi:cell differentiation protein rcd1, partial [Entamoeba invadens IP1]
MSVNPMFPPLSAKPPKRQRNKESTPQPQSPAQEKQEKVQSPKVEKVQPKQETPPAAQNNFNLPGLPPNTCQLIADLADVEKRVDALHALSLIADKHPDLAIPLWYSFGTVVILLEEVVSVYPHISGKHKEPLSVSSCET